MAEAASERLRESRARYDRMARYYTPMMRLMAKLYRGVAAAVQAPPGGCVVELGCGPATLTPHLRAALDPATRIVGVDFSGEMLVRARQRAEREGWRNVSFEQASALEWKPPRPVDAVVISLALTIFPEPLRCLDQALSWLVPGGQLVVLDSFLIPGRRIANWIVRAKAPMVAADPGAVPFDALLARLLSPRVASLFGGSYTLVSGRPDRTL